LQRPERRLLQPEGTNGMANQQNNFYKPLILLLLVSFLIFSAWSARQASNQGSQVTDRDYYSKGLKYNSTMVEKRAAEVLGWTLNTKIIDQTLIFQVTDGKGKYITNAQGILYLYLPDSPQGRSFDLQQTPSGEFQLALPPKLSGTLRARVTFERNGAKLNRQLQLNL